MRHFYVLFGVLAAMAFTGAAEESVPPRVTPKIEVDRPIAPPEVTIPLQRVAAPRPPPLAVSPKISLEEAMYVPPKFRTRVKPVYPFELLRDGVAGAARVGCFIDQNGAIVNAQAVQATRPEFGAALVAAVEASTFAMATNEGEPIPTILAFVHEFSHRAPNAAEVCADEELLDRVRRRPRTLSRPAELDEPLRPKTQVAPTFPLALRRRDVEGTATVEFVLDERGRARVPRILSASDPAFGYAAVQAVVQWEFEPPTVKGTPALVKVIVPFTFSLTER
jgi:TonB family protein